ncbi:hypothetical protein [Lacrimispora saccharolytica]|uniref:Uncharacterized protein n=1 Tax=Lacrimispora saccharolytica (strain ATCC 35040 / DSM 2544 / NRCC 2533 / WM1) TaxID=610130 RepID=D9R7K0_LACSW|nr:hypothetical protein [Lacrimispora saccharolytica]ADL03729.1 hypothetical protein Closa_1113 [[Clostridium] saccharolyticum WM1]QRV18140.1 hypothetical protein I6K70_11210 [Lacrimispora saccharolytica]
MMRGKAILKSFKETRNHDVLFEYGRLLEQQGWKCILIEGGYLSPDHSTIFICMRAPYEGQLLQYSSDGEENYLLQVKAMVESGDFTE